jgi:hypothetical protein
LLTALTSARPGVRLEHFDQDRKQVCLETTKDIRS